MTFLLYGSSLHILVEDVTNILFLGYKKSTGVGFFKIGYEHNLNLQMP